MRKKVYVRSLDGFLSVCSTISNYIKETLMNRGSGRTRFKDRSCPKADMLCYVI